MLSTMDASRPHQPTDIRPADLPWKTLDRCPPPSSSMPSTVPVVCRSPYPDEEDQLDTEVIIWSSKTNSSGPDRLEQPRRPYSVASFPIRSGLNQSTTHPSLSFSSRRPTFEETTVNNEATVRWRPPAATPRVDKTLPSSMMQFDRSPVANGNKSLPYDEANEQPHLKKTVGDFQSGPPTRRAPGSQPFGYDQPDYRPPPDAPPLSSLPAARRHSEAPSSGNGATDLFLSRSGIITGDENDVIDDVTNSGLKRSM